MMKKALLFLLAASLSIVACHKDPQPKADGLDLSGISKTNGKLYVLNEGGLGANNASLDFLRFSDRTYVTGAFKAMNPDVGGGLGDVANDIAIVGDEAWIVVNNSGLVEIISAKTEKEIATISIPSPRNIAFDDRYAYVTSWAGAYAQYVYDEKGNGTLTSYENPRGSVYRINLITRKVEGQLEVGYQPEGIAFYDGRIYVANSGGISCQLPPSYAYDKTLSVIDASTFKVSKTVDIDINLQKVYSDGKGNIYVTSMGDYFSTHSALWILDTNQEDKVSKVSDYVSVSALYGETLYCIGTENEFDWQAAHSYQAWCCTDGEKSAVALDLGGTNPYGLFVLERDVFVVSDALDYFNPGTVSLFVKGKKQWTITAGVCPAHFALY